jgi:NAD(P)-dependent dehydrogenase (short-subunit alcohol dehydrogenase family)
MTKLGGDVAVVTGAGRGIGRATALALAKEGARLGLCARTVEELEETAALARDAGAPAVRVVRADVSRGPEVAAALAEIERELGPAGILVNNAGTVEPAPVVDTSEESWDRVLAVNLKGPFLAARAVLPGMLARGRGRVINVASISATLGTPRLASYCASKWGLVGFTKALAEEVKERGVLVAAVLPGSTDTTMLKKSGFPPRIVPAEIAEAIRWLACDAPPAAAGTALEVFG